MGEGACKLTELSQTPNTATSRVPLWSLAWGWVGESGSETAGEKVRGREGNSPDRQLRSLSVC